MPNRTHEDTQALIELLNRLNVVDRKPAAAPRAAVLFFRAQAWRPGHGIGAFPTALN